MTYQTPPALAQNDFSNQIEFEVTSAGTYTISIDNCPGLSWNETVNQTSCNQITIYENPLCNLTVNLSDCLDYTAFNWEYTDDPLSNTQLELAFDVNDFAVNLNGFYRVCAQFPDCNEVCSDYILIENCNIDCANADTGAAHFIDADIILILQITLFKMEVLYQQQ